MPASSGVIPKGYTFLNDKLFLSEGGKKILLSLLESSDNRNPDFFDMYIYNDYHSYGVLDLIHTQLSRLQAKVKQKKWRKAMEIVEALVIFFSMEDIWTQCDDGELVKVAHKAFGALFATLIQSIKKDDELDVEHYPNLETILHYAADWDDFMEGIECEAGYGKICKAIGRRLFANKSEEVRELEKKRVQEWMDKLPVDIREDYVKSKGQDEEDNANDGEDRKDGEWFEDGLSVDEDKKIKALARTRTGKKYKDYLGGGRLMPFRGPPKWDLTTWTNKEKKKFFHGRL